MKPYNKDLDKEILGRLEKHGILLDRNISVSKKQALVLIGEAILDKFVKEINEFVSLWRELFPNCRLQDFEASEEEKKKILGGQDPAENGNSKPNEHANNDLCIREMQTEAGIEYWDMPTLGRKTVKAEHQLISDLWRNSSVLYQPGKKKTSNYKQKKRQPFLPGYIKHYQFPKRLKSYSYGSIKLPSLHKSFGKLVKNTRNLSPFAKMLQIYQRQIGRESFELGRASYKSLESYLNNYKEVG